LEIVLEVRDGGDRSERGTCREDQRPELDVYGGKEETGRGKKRSEGSSRAFSSRSMCGHRGNQGARGAGGGKKRRNKPAAGAPMTAMKSLWREEVGQGRMGGKRKNTNSPGQKKQKKKTFASVPLTAESQKASTRAARKKYEPIQLQDKWGIGHEIEGKERNEGLKPRLGSLGRGRRD